MRPRRSQKTRWGAKIQTYWWESQIQQNLGPYPHLRSQIPAMEHCSFAVSPFSGHTGTRRLFYFVPTVFSIRGDPGDTKDSSRSSEQVCQTILDSSMQEKVSSTMHCIAFYQIDRFTRLSILKTKIMTWDTVTKLGTRHRDIRAQTCSWIWATHIDPPWQKMDIFFSPFFDMTMKRSK